MRCKIRCFNSRTPCGVRQTGFDPNAQVSRFQFTHPVRGATQLSSIAQTVDYEFQFTHPVRGATLSGEVPSLSDAFQFTHPVRGATALQCGLKKHDIVSIHAPRAGCDTTELDFSSLLRSFNSRTPCGVRHRCPKVRINRRLDDDPLRTEDYKRVCRCVGGDCEAVCACISTCANSLPFL